MKFSKLVAKGLLTAAISGALALVPMAMSTATANADSVNWDAIAECESGGNWSINSGNGHYGGKAEVYMDVGEAMGKAMVKLLKGGK